MADTTDEIAVVPAEPRDGSDDPAEPRQGADDPAAGPRTSTRHYTRSALLSHLLDALAAAGRRSDPLDPDDLAELDHLAAGGRAVTVELVDLLAPPDGAHVLDLGCGLGGPARYLVGHRGCRVTGVDLSRERVDLAAELTARCGLAGLAEFHEADVTALPFGDESFDAAVLLHVGMSVPDKARLCAEAGRVLRPDGRLAVYDIMRAEQTEPAVEPTYPLPWASSAEVSFLETPAEYRWQLTEAGFAVEEGREPTGSVPEHLRGLLDDPAALGPHLVLGESARPRMAHLADALRDGLLVPMLLVATKSAG